MAAGMLLADLASGQSTRVAEADSLDKAVHSVVNLAEKTAEPAGNPTRPEPVHLVQPAATTPVPAAGDASVLFQDFWGVDVDGGAFDLKFIQDGSAADRGKVLIYGRTFHSGNRSVAKDFVENGDWTSEVGTGGTLHIHLSEADRGECTYELNPGGRSLKLAPGSGSGRFTADMLTQRILTEDDMGVNARQILAKYGSR